jgi:hypothetical protein
MLPPPGTPRPVETCLPALQSKPGEECISVPDNDKFRDLAKEDGFQQRCVTGGRALHCRPARCTERDKPRPAPVCDLYRIPTWDGDRAKFPGRRLVCQSYQKYELAYYGRYGRKIWCDEPPKPDAPADPCDAYREVACKAQCDGGSAASCAKLAEMYRSGVGAMPDLIRAASALAQACEIGELDACVGYAELHESRQVGDRGRAQALARTACDGGRGLGCYYVGLLLDPYLHTSPGQGEAYATFARCCNEGVRQCCLGRARMLAEGAGVKQDVCAALDLVTRVCDSGSDGIASDACAKKLLLAPECKPPSPAASASSAPSPEPARDATPPRTSPGCGRCTTHVTGAGGGFAALGALAMALVLVRRRWS